MVIRKSALSVMLLAGMFMFGCGCALQKPQIQQTVTPDTISRTEAMVIATAHTNAFLATKRFVDENGKEQHYAHMSFFAWREKIPDEDGWLFRCVPTPPAPYICVRVSKDGQRSTIVKYGFRTE